MVLRGNRIEEFDFESQAKQQLKGNIYLAKVTRVEPSLQAAFVDYGGNRHGFLAFNEIHPDYYQIPVADRQALLDEDAADARRERAIEDQASEDQASEDQASEKQSNEDLANDSSVEKATNSDLEVSPSDSADNEEEIAPTIKAKRRVRRGRKKSTAQETPKEELPSDKTEDGEAVGALDGENSAGSNENDSEAVVIEAGEKNTDVQSDVLDNPDNSSQEPSTHSEQEPPLESEDNATKVIKKGDDKPTSIAAMMETDSISEPAPADDNGEDEDTTDSDDGAGGIHDEEAAKATNEKPVDKPPVKKRARTARRPRKSAKVAADGDDKIEASGDRGQDDSNSASKENSISQPEIATSKSKDNSVSKDELSEQSSAETRENGNADGQKDAPTGGRRDEEKISKPKSRRKQRSPRSRKKPSTSVDDVKSKTDDDSDKNANENDEDNNGRDLVESSGQEDALEEVPQRRKPRRQYKIQEVVKRRQVLLVQIVKEERGNKGAALTTYLSLAGRYSVLMPNTARGGGISRKITNTADRKRLKKIATELEVPEGMGVILRTAGASRTKAEIQRDFEYLMRLWENVRNLTLSSSAPCLVYEEGSLIKRSIRDLYDKNTGEVLVAGEAGYKEAQEFMAMLMPSHAKNVKLYRDEQAILARFGVEQQLDRMLSQQVTLKSGGYLVIDQTEALVAIDVNSGRSTREHSIEETALQTNLETAEEVARQLRLRDLAGLIVIDFIDMEEKRNNRAVEKKLKECLKHDRARIQVGRISHFGLLEMSRQRMRASVLESTMNICSHCQGKGHVRSNTTVSLHILRAIEEHLLKNSRFDLIVNTAGEIALYILNYKRSALIEIEERFGLRIFIRENHEFLGENFTLEKGEASTGERKPLTHIQAGQMSQLDHQEEEIRPEESEPVDEVQPASKRRRRRRGNKSETENNTAPQEISADENKEQNLEGGEKSKRKRQRGKRAGRNKQNSKNIENKTTENATNDKSGASPVEQANLGEPVKTVGEKTDATAARASRNSRPGKAKKGPLRDTGAEISDELPDNNSTRQNLATSDGAAPDNTNTPKEKSRAQPDNSDNSRAKRQTTRRRIVNGDAPINTEATASSDNSAESGATQSEPHISDVKTKIGDDDHSKVQTGDVPGIGLQENSNDDGEKMRGGWWSRNGFFK